MILGNRSLLVPITVVLLVCAALILHWPKKEIIEEKKPATKVAIVIDDMGYNLDNIERIYGIERPLTLSILPNLSYSKKIATETAKRGYEVILHLPLESSQKDAPMEAGTIRIDMTSAEVLEKLDIALGNVSAMRGVSNHMGSKATEEKALMRIIFEELRRRKLYFLDSLVTPRSVCEDIAEEVGIKFAKRDVYLDNLDDAEYIKKQFGLLIKKARKEGSSIGIGHDRALTIEMLVEEMPKAEEEGIEFVFVSELAE